MDREQIHAEKLDELIAASLAGGASPTADLNATDRLVVDALTEIASSTRVDPHFVITLEAKLQQTMAADSEVDRRAKAHTLWSRWSLQWADLYTQFGLTQRFIAVSTVAIMLLVVILLTPTARASILDFFFGFLLIEEQRVEEAAVDVVVPTVDPEAPTAMNLAEIHRHAPFPVRILQRLPADLTFTRGFVLEADAGIQVTLVYHPQDKPITATSPALLQIINQGSVENLPLLPEEYAESVQIQGQLGLFVRGGWQTASLSQSTQAMPTVLEDLTWNPVLDSLWLTWYEDDLAYLLQADGLHFTQGTLVEIAESME